MDLEELDELIKLAKEKNLFLMEWVDSYSPNITEDVKLIG